MKARRDGRFWVITLAAVVGIAVTASLGVWQLGRAADKRALLAARAAQAARPAVDWTALHDAHARGQLDTLVGRPVRLTGRWVPEATVYLDNRPMEGRAGFVVVTPLLPADGNGPGLVVQRGWLPRDAQDRTRVPPVFTPTVSVTVEGVLAPPPSPLLQLGPDTGGRIRQNIEIPAYGGEWRLALLPTVSVQQTGPAEPSADALPLQRAWPVVAVDPAKHVGYAVQWFALATLILALYVWFQFLSPRRRHA